MSQGHGHHENLQPTENLLKGSQIDRTNTSALVRGVFEGGKDSAQVVKDLGVTFMDKFTHASPSERSEHYKTLMHDLNKVCQDHLFKDKHTHVIGVSMKGGERGLMVEDAKGNVMRINLNGESELMGTHDSKGKFIPAKHEQNRGVQAHLLEGGPGQHEQSNHQRDRQIHAKNEHQVPPPIARPQEF